MLNKNFSNRPLYGVFLSGAQKVLDRPLYFLPIPSTVPRTRARSELLNVSLVPPRVEFYTALPVSIVGRY